MGGHRFQQGGVTLQHPYDGRGLKQIVIAHRVMGLSRQGMGELALPSD
jgi:hypothetical protein